MPFLSVGVSKYAGIVAHVTVTLASKDLAIGLVQFPGCQPGIYRLSGQPEDRACELRDWLTRPGSL